MSFVGKWFGFGKNVDFDEGVRAYEKRSFREAIDSFRKCDRSSAEAAVRERAKSYIAGSLAKLAKDAYAGRDFETALGYLTEAAEIRPGFADIWLWKAKTFAALGRTGEATKAVGASLEINPQYAAAMLLNGILLYGAGDREAGVKALREAAALDDRIDGTEFLAGMRAHEALDFESALDQFKQIDPRGGDVNEMLAQGDQLAKNGSWTEAAEQFRTAVSLAPSYADVHVRYGQALLEVGTLSEAAQSFQRAIAINPDYAEAYALMGVAYRRQSDEENAMTAFHRALEIDPNHPIASQEVLYRPR